jgi:glyoxylase-like metal-dependent hydrolase (beta-lactamase superfamily II)
VHDWFAVTDLGRGVTAISEPHHRQRVISYLVGGRDRALLFDTGMGIGDMAALVSALTTLPVVAVVSHSHFDHVGGLSGFEIRGAYGGCPATLAVLSRGRPAGTMAKRLPAVLLSPPYPAGMTPEAYAIKPAAPNLLLSDGSVIDLGDRLLEVLHLPGHSPDSTAILDWSNRQAFTGDFFYGGPLYAHLPDSDPTAYLASLRRAAALLASGVDRLLCGHNEPVQSPGKVREAADLLAALPPGPPRGGRQLHRASGDGFSVLARRGP